MAREIWIEFKQVVLPWLLAAAVIVLHQWTVERYTLGSESVSAAIKENAIVLDGVRSLLAERGYTVAPSPLPAGNSSRSKD